MLPAARVTDKVRHSRDSSLPHTGLVAGAILGVASFFTGGTVAAVGLVGRLLWLGRGLVVTVEAASLGQDVGNAFEISLRLLAGADEIIEGADHVFTNTKKAAIADPKCKMKQHPDKFVITGAEHVFIENARASRALDYTNCPGQIVTGSPNVTIGGPITPMADTKSVLDYFGQAVSLFGIARNLARGADITRWQASQTAISITNQIVPQNDFTTGAGSALKIFRQLTGR